jgi:hypothetical protein
MNPDDKRTIPNTGTELQATEAYFEVQRKARELATEAITERFGEVEGFAGTWDILDVRRALGRDGFVFLFDTPLGKHGAAISVLGKEMQVEFLF